MNPDARDAWQPAQALDIVAGTPPGGGLDRTARALATAIGSAALVDVPVRVVNVPGDGARKAWSYMNSHAGDAHVASISHPNLTTDYLTGVTRFDHSAYTPIAILSNEYIAFVARSGSRFATEADLLAALAADAGSITVALSTALGNPNHMALARVVQHARGDVRAPAVRVFDSALHAVADVVERRSDIAAVTAASALQALAAGSVRALAVSAPARLGGPFAGTPTWHERGVDCVIGAWRGVTGAAGLTAAQVEFWQDVCAAAVATPAWARSLERYCWTPMYLDRDALHDYLEAECRDMHAILTELGMAAV
jgi:putative tricarboxylic transport membrane protein